MPARRSIEPALPRPCAQCPWRLSNQGQPHPHGFYSAANLRRLWNGLRTGEAPGMSCHPTDPSMAEFEGYEQTADRAVTHECAGAVVLITREAKRFEALCKQAEAGEIRSALREYRRLMPKGMTHGGLLATVERFVFGGTPYALKFRTNAEAVNDPEIGYPPLGDWDPSILEQA